MNEVSAQTAALLLDAIEHRGFDPDTLWSGLPVTHAQLRDRAGRLDWETWVEMMARTEARCGVDQTERLFVAGAGARTNHAFVRIANTFLSLGDVYKLFARWGLSRSLVVMTARFEQQTPVAARFSIAIDPARVGSLPTFRFIAGVLRNLPGLQGLPPAGVRIEPGATPHRVSYQLTLPRERGMVARARRMVRLAGGAAAALDELEQQAAEIATQNQALAAQLAETERAAAALRERETWLDLALDAGQIGLWRWDPERKRVWVSEGLGQLLGVQGASEIDPTIWMARIHPEDLAPVRMAMTQCIEDGVPYQVEYRLTRPTGELAWLSTRGRAVAYAGGAQVFGTVADQTERKLLDARLRAADRLIAAGTLAAGVAHEINNPLTYVLGNVDMLRAQLQASPGSPPAALEALGHVREGAERIRDVVADLRAFARPDERVVVRIEPRTVCDASLRIVSGLVRHRSEITTDYDPATPAIMANESRLGQVLINLIINASHAMPDRPTGANRIVVRTCRRPSGEAAIEVIDNGTGIAPEVVPRLFDPFFTTKTIGEGTGLGLSVCQSIVGSLHGRIEVDSAVGRGATFAVVLPAAPPVPAAIPIVQTPPQPIAERGGGRVLVIDDEPVVRRVVAAMLAATGYEVVEAEHGRAGLEAALASGFDAIVCDLMMPELDGVAVHAALAEQRPDLLPRLVFVTGGAVSPRTRAFVERPDVTILTKPFSFDELRAAVARIAAR